MLLPVFSLLVYLLLISIQAVPVRNFYAPGTNFGNKYVNPYAPNSGGGFGQGQGNGKLFLHFLIRVIII